MENKIVCLAKSRFSAFTNDFYLAECKKKKKKSIFTPKKTLSLQLKFSQFSLPLNSFHISQILYIYI